LKKQLESDSEDSDKPVTDDDSDDNMNDTPTQAENQNHYDAHETII
jgi:hypothetical protein